MRRRLSVLSIALLFAALPVRAAATKDCKLEKYGELPVAMRGTMPLVSGSINGIDAWFLADSGAFFSMLSLESTQKYKLRLGPLPRGMSVRGIGGTADARMTNVQDFTLPGFNPPLIHKIDFVVSGNSFGSEVAGIIGQNIIGHADTEYDLANGFIRLFHTSKGCSDQPLAYWASTAAQVAAMDIDRMTPGIPQPIGTAKLNGTRIRVVFDTGASRSILTLRAAARAGIKPDREEVLAGGLSNGIGRRLIETSVARFDLLDLGGEQVKNARLRIGDIDLRDADMLLGADFFLSHRIYVAAGQRKIYFTYNGGSVFNLGMPTKAATTDTSSAASNPATAADTNATPNPAMDAAAFRRRGLASLGRRELQKAIADFDQAIQLDPSDAQSYYQRGVARMQNRQPVLAMSDLDRALQLRPDDVAALMDRGALRLATRDEAGAATDFDTALNLSPHDPILGLAIARTYINTKHFAGALNRFDQWIAAHPKDDHIAVALDGRCLSRAMMGRELDQALEDCNAALKKGPRTSQMLASRGLVRLRLGDFDKSISDYKASLKLQPKNPGALYGLGLAEMRQGAQAAADRDIQAATAITPGIAQEFKRIGLSP